MAHQAWAEAFDPRARFQVPYLDLQLGEFGKAVEALPAFSSPVDFSVFLA